MMALSLIDSPAAHFLSALGDGHETFTALNKRDARFNRVLHGSWAQLERRLQVYNEQFGCDVYINANRMDVGGRRRENIRGLRTLFADYDHGVPETWALSPSILVETSPGKAQAYWLLDGEIETHDSEMIELWRRTEHALVDATGADPGARDASRILRVPGFRNLKYEDKPAVRLIHATSARYSLQHFASAFGLELPRPHGQLVADAMVLGGDGATSVKRLRGWLRNAAAPARGHGHRNRWFFRAAAFGARNLAMPPATVAQHLADFAARRYDDDKYDYDMCLQLARNAAASGTHAKGAGFSHANVQISLE